MGSLRRIAGRRRVTKAIIKLIQDVFGGKWTTLNLCRTKRIPATQQDGISSLFQKVEIRWEERPVSIEWLNEFQGLDLDSNQLGEMLEWVGQLNDLQALDLSSNELGEVPEWIGQLRNLQVLDLSSNKLGEVPEWVGQLRNLQAFDLGGNQLEEVPEALGQLNNLKVLDLSSNKLEEVPEWVGQLRNLQVLDLGGNQLEEVPEALGQLNNLRGLGLSINRLRVLPEALGQLSNLQVLDLRNYQNLPQGQLTTLPEVLGELRNLQVLDLGGNELTTLPEVLGELRNLQVLDLGGNELTTLPEVLGELRNLQVLDLGGNELTTLPEGLGELSQLQSLYLDNNQLRSLPEGLGELSQLQSLRLSHNKLTTLPEVLGELRNLQVLDLSFNWLRVLPKALGQLSSLQRLNLFNNQLTTLPEGLGELRNLQVLDLSYNRLRVLPKALGQLSSLQSLYLSSNQLRSLPEGLGELSQLQSLSLSYNRLRVLPKALGQLSSLQSLTLSSNQLTTLPEGLGELSQLQSLYLDNNELTALPEGFGELRNLQVLGLDNNELTTLPEGLGELSQLQSLYLDNNELMTLPPALAQLDSLSSLKLEDNPLDPILTSAVESGLDSLRAYLASLAEADPLYEAKLVLVGEGAVGKTTLLKALSGRDPREGESTTHGIEIDRQPFELPHAETGAPIQFNAWDFGGQEVYRVTHQFFFSPRAIYLLVWEPRLGVQQCQVEDWLNLIWLRVGEGARVIIVSTHCQTGERIARIDRPYFKDTFGEMIVGFHAVDSLVDDPETDDKVGLAALKETIAAAASGLDHMGSLFNRDWHGAREALLARPEPRISYTEFGALCQDYNLNEIATRTLADMMHDLGYIIYYSDDEALKDEVVLKPEWLTKAIGFVLEDATTHIRAGILPDSRLRAVWASHSFKDQPRYEPALYPFFLRLMEKFDVSYRLETGDGSLVAQHVPQVRPKLPWLPAEEPAPDRRRLSMVCVLDEVPTGLVPWMIVRTHDYAYERRGADGGVERLHWDRGMFLKDKAQEALLELRGREFRMYTEAVLPKMFMDTLQLTLQKLIDDNWPGLKDRYTFSVPCQGKKKDQPCPGRFEIEALREFSAEGDDKIRCLECRSWQNIVELLTGFEEEDPQVQLDRIERGVAEVAQGIVATQAAIDELNSRLANYVLTVLRAIASESKDGPRLFSMVPRGGGLSGLTTRRYGLYLWCEAEGEYHLLEGDDRGQYEISVSREWVQHVAPYANFVVQVLKAALPMVAPAVSLAYGPTTLKDVGWQDELDLMKAASGTVLQEVEVRSDRSALRGSVLNEDERSGVLALHALLREQDPHHAKLGLRRIETYTGEFRWLCDKHYQESRSKIPERFDFE